MDFHDNVHPFGEVLPKELFEDIASFHSENFQPSQDQLLPPRHGKIVVDSTIINSKHTSILANWIQRKDVNTRIPIGSKINFDLIYRGSRDGYDINTIRGKCNRKGACILIIKVEGDETIIGGYNPIGWDYHNQNYSNNRDYSWTSTTESFIFSLDDEKYLKGYKISRVEDSNHAMYESSFYNYKLNFGNGDLVIEGNVCTCKQEFYESSIFGTNEEFIIKEMEIFRFHQGE